MQIGLERISRLLPQILSGTIALLILLSVSNALGQDTGSTQPEDLTEKPHGVFGQVNGIINAGGAGTQADFKPMSQRERNNVFLHKLSSPLLFTKAAASAGLHQWKDAPEEWEQGASGYGKRYADVLGQYAIRDTVKFGLESLLHEDNRYFSSGKKGVGPRVGYALSSSFLARHDNGKRYPSISLIVALASEAGLSRLWQPPDAKSASSAASRFAVTVGWNTGFVVLKEFLPDLLRPFKKRH